MKLFTFLSVQLAEAVVFDETWMIKGRTGRRTRLQSNQADAQAQAYKFRSKTQSEREAKAKNFSSQKAKRKRSERLSCTAKRKRIRQAKNSPKAKIRQD